MARKSRSQLREEKRQKRVRLVMVAIMVGLMVLSSFAFIMVFYAPTTQNGAGAVPGLDYRVEENRILVDVGDREVPFYSFPDTTVDVPPQAVQLLEDASMVVVAFDPTDERNLPYVELVRFDLGRYVDAQQGALLLQNSTQYDFPIGGCEQATASTPVVRIVNESYGISVNDSCITIAGQQQVLMQLRDQLLYAYYGER